MNMLAQTNNTDQVTMSSLEIVDFINEYRAKNESNPVQLRRYSKTNRLEIQKAEDANYGSVNSYHKDAWLAVYNINLSSMRGV